MIYNMDGVNGWVKALIYQNETIQTTTTKPHINKLNNDKCYLYEIFFPAQRDKEEEDAKIGV